MMQVAPSCKVSRRRAGSRAGRHNHASRLRRPFWALADILQRNHHVRFTPKSIQCSAAKRPIQFPMIPRLRGFSSAFFASASHRFSSSRKERWTCGSLLLRAISAHSRACCRSRSAREFIWMPLSFVNLRHQTARCQLIQINIRASEELLRDDRLSR